MRRTRTIGTVCLMALFALGAVRSSPGTASAEGCRSYQEMMQSLKREVSVLLISVLDGDLPAAARAADDIFEQPHPPMAEENRVLASLGIDAGPFRQLENQIRLHAESLETAARRGDLLQTSERFKDLVGACLRCHFQYRSAVREASREQGRSPP